MYMNMHAFLQRAGQVLRPEYCSYKGKGKGKSIQLQAWTGPEVSMRLRLPDFPCVTMCHHISTGLY